MNYTTPANCLFAVSDFEVIKQNVLNWTQQFGTFCFLDNHQYQAGPHSMECLLAAGARRSIGAPAGQALQQLQDFISNSKAAGREPWLLGHLGYDLKNELEALRSTHPDRIGFPDLFFFEPQVLIRFNETEMHIEAEDPQAVFDEIIQQPPQSGNRSGGPVRIRQRMNREEYLATIRRLQEHILRGDCYEINFCQEFYAEQVKIDPLAVYRQLSLVSPNPFSALYRAGDRWLICASPERYLRRQGRTILSQPIKGTSKRVPGNKEGDEQSRSSLQQSAKDRSENVMVVDLVRNDLAKVCREGSVKVDELFGIYSFPQVHQMISTVSGELKEDVSFAEIIRASFPMGSMTGAPKKRVMELIEQYERSRRGIFSGALGYISPGGDFDFNVVIRSILYNAATGYLSYQTGSGITYYSDAEKEWEECLVKAEAIHQVLGAGTY